MKKQIYISLVALVSAFLVAACGNLQSSGGEAINILQNILAQGNGTWRVASASFGDEEASLNMFDDYRITFRPDGTYQVTNPKGAPSFTRRASGRYAVTMERVLVFDGGETTAREMTRGNLRPDRLIFEFDVTLPGKSTTTYRFELVR
ncbi:hypothetical protein [Rhodoflexus sp.]